MKGQLEFQLLARGMLPVEAEAHYKALEAERKRLTTELAEVPAAPAIELHPHASAVENLASRLLSFPEKTRAAPKPSFDDRQKDCVRCAAFST